MSVVYNKTPLLRKVFQNSQNLPQFFLKYECLQPSGSFKSRGIGNLILKSATQINKIGNKKPHVFASSGGNAGFAAATACKTLNLPCTVVVPKATKQRMVEKIKDTGANVIINGAHWKEADIFLKNSIMNKIDNNLIEPIYVHPFDNPQIWEGHSTLVDEMIESLESQNVPLTKIKGIVCSVGGGGLYNGIIQGLERFNLANKIPIVGVETKGCHVFNTSLKMNKPIQFEKITSIATSLGTANISDKTFEYAKKYNTKSVVVEDIDVIETCLNYTQSSNMVTEPACGAAIHLAYHTDILEKALGQKLSADDVILIIACGGSSNTISDLETTLVRLKEEKSLKNIPFINSTLTEGEKHTLRLKSL
ncbi:similar to Saccharomyces cerevisiae YCL064C CHA1 Catabolic L-serine (L-threonine) deaminase, catalyzes the degradation of both L-serine and L-threonine [Maudiozyma saulgeensis]|uniref:L-serine ammonia-lyase n=1 Tax=Maudiozyma saulgeensis TaxID=1789683 RepID=A0A1X7R3R6_9SACH|nr:similar to Saccharomyces cerevisiae YCL064C CHA1 Catabolic L-serine (L-threonine) deaminase, catalyzes the degradation of both L-serine and L-threonine [Kazachstania saulgeensis]